MAIALLTGFTACVLSQIYIEISYDYQMPASQPETGRVYQIRVNHGDVRYVSQKEFERAHFIRYKMVLPEILLFAALGILRARYKEL